MVLPSRRSSTAFSIRSRPSQHRGASPKAGKKNLSRVRMETPQFSASALTEYFASRARSGQFWMRCKGELFMPVVSLPEVREEEFRALLERFFPLG